MRRLVGAVLCALAVAGVGATSAGAATYTSNADCLVCHDVSGSGATSRVDFGVDTVPRVGGVDLTKCVACHRGLPDLVSFGGGLVPGHYHASWSCQGCHDGVESFPVTGDTNITMSLANTAFGYFRTSASLAVPKDVLHAVHKGGRWVDTDPNLKPFGCSRCHGTASCSACHDAPVNGDDHQAHGATQYAAPATDQATGATVTRAPLSCVQANCHALSKAGTSAFNDPSCMQTCHADKADPHGYELADHVADDGSLAGVACSSCHSLDLDTEHGGGACAACHPTPRDTLGAWDQSCVTGGCHTPSSGAPFHAAADTAHTLPASAQECGECHEGVDLTEVHAAADDGAGNTSCFVCHGPGENPSTNDCTTCHFTAGAHPGGVHAAAASPGCGGTGCHDISDVRTNHAASPAGACAVCHANPARVPELPATSDCVNCHAAEGGAPHYADHWANPPLVSGGVPNYAFYTGSAPGGPFTTACATCHASNLIDAHLGSVATLAQKDRFGSPLTCDSCHASANPDVVLAIAGGLTKCDACHSNPMTGGAGVHGPVNPTHASTFKDTPEVPCSPCHSPNVVDEHNGTRSWPDANGVQLAYCSVCHDNHAGERGQQIQDAIEVENDVRCTACHSATHPDAGGHVATTVASLSCGECHAPGQTSIDVRALHAGSAAGPCAVCHDNPARVSDVTLATAECASCHATEGTDHHRGLPGKHVDDGMAATCQSASCHPSTALPEAHESYLSRYPAYATTCALCHMNTDPGRIPDDATAACDSCHTPIHPGMDHTADASGECVDCHETADALALHEDAAGGPCDVCHANPARVPTLPESIECVSCHDYSPPAESHYPVVNHTAASMGRTVSAGGSASAGCGECHDASLLSAHATMSSSFYGPSLGCVECHNDTRANGRTEVLADWSTDRCDDCHSVGSSKVMHSTTTAPPVPAASSASCAASGAGCHATMDLHDLHKGASSCALAGCHDVKDAKPVNKSCGVGGTCHVSYNETTHYVASPTHTADVTTVYTYAGTSNACSVCHSAELKPAHRSLPQSTCLNCHNSTDPDSVAVITSAAPWNKSCMACHTVYHGQVGGAHAGQPPAGNTCLGVGCHASNSTDLVTVHSGVANSCAIAGCHDSSAKDGRPLTKACATCHPDKTDEHGDHTFTTASDYSQSAGTGCTNSGSGCHGGDTLRDARTYHTGCAGCHGSSSYAGYPAPDFDCARCHDGDYSGAPDVITLTGTSPDGHYGQAAHTAMQMTREVGAGGTAKAACGVCHDASLYPAHGSMSASFYGPSLSCYECHNDTRSNGVAQVLADWTNNRCDDCHTAGTKIMHSVTTAPAVNGTTSAGCVAAGCHVSELHALHKDAASCALAGCHDVKNAVPAKKSCGTGGACHASATGNHEAQHDTQGVIDPGCYGCHFRYLTEEHTALGHSCGTCHDSTSSVVQGAIAADDRRCLTCHPGSAHNARQAVEFAPGNASLHRVRADLPGMRSSFVVNGSTYTWTLPSASSFLRSGFGYDTVVACDSCHTFTGTTGPHGAAMKVNIDPAYPNPYRVVNGNESFTAQLSKDSPTGMSMSKSGSARANIICEKCHDLNGSGSTFSNVAHSEHDDRGREGSFCNQCHVAVPHGWGRPRLIGYVSDAAPYRTWVGTSGARDGGLTRITVKSYTPNGWQRSDCGAGCSSSRHPLTGSSWPNVMAAPADPTKGSVTGTVTDSVSGAPVSGATVAVGTVVVTTGADGTYTVPNLVAGVHPVTVSKTGYTTWTGSASATAGTTTRLDVRLVPAPTATNFARTGTATASSSNSSGTGPSKAIDGSTLSYWQSGSSGTQWLRVDLGSSRSVSRVVVNWNGSNYARSYRIETSSDGTNWTTRFSTTSGTSGTKTHTFSAAAVRYVRLTCTSAYVSSYRVNEFEVWDF